LPTPAIEKLKQAVNGVVAVSEKAVRTATPVVRRTAEDVVNRLRGDQSPTSPAQPPSTTKPSEATGPAEQPDATAPKPTPAAIAKNVAHQRPVAAEPPPARKPKPSDSPGGKLPPRN